MCNARCTRMFGGLLCTCNNTSCLCLCLCSNSCSIRMHSQSAQISNDMRIIFSHCTLKSSWDWKKHSHSRSSHHIQDFPNSRKNLSSLEKCPKIFSNVFLIVTIHWMEFHRDWLYCSHSIHIDLTDSEINVLRIMKWRENYEKRGKRRISCDLFTVKVYDAETNFLDLYSQVCFNQFTLGAWMVYGAFPILIWAHALRCEASMSCMFCWVISWCENGNLARNYQTNNKICNMFNHLQLFRWKSEYCRFVDGYANECLCFWSRIAKWKFWMSNPRIDDVGFCDCDILNSFF